MPRILNPAQVDAFYRKGYLLMQGLFSGDDVLQIQKAIGRLYDAARQEAPVEGGRRHNGSKIYHTRAGSVERVVWAGGAEPVLLEKGRDRRLTGIIADLFGNPQADHLLNQVHFKNPGDGVSFAFHQDCTHRRFGDPQCWNDVDGRGSYVQTLLAIDPMTEENGPLLVVPGNPGRDLRIRPEESTRFLDHATPVLMSPGDLLAFSPYLIHGSEPNRSKVPRWSIINGYAYPGANKRTFDIPGAGERIDLS